MAKPRARRVTVLCFALGVAGAHASAAAEEPPPTENGPISLDMHLPEAGSGLGEPGELRPHGPTPQAVHVPEVELRPIAVVSTDADPIGPKTQTSAHGHRAIVAALQKRLVAVRACYARALAADPKLAGKLTVRVTAHAHRPATVAFLDRSVPDSLAECVRFHLTDLRVTGPAADGASAVTAMVFSADQQVIAARQPAANRGRIVPPTPQPLPAGTPKKTTDARCRVIEEGQASRWVPCQ